MSESLYRILAWMSPGFPVGAYAYSHGLEWAVEAGAIRDRSSLERWLVDLLTHGGLRNDAILLAATLRAAPSALRSIAELAWATATTRERRLETTAQGRAFAEACATAWPSPNLAALGAELGPERLAYPVAVGVAAADHRVDPAAMTLAFVHAASANLISAAVRLVPLGQSDGQRALANLIEPVGALAQFARHATLDDLGGAAFASEIAAMQHETQYTRLFRT